MLKKTMIVILLSLIMVISFSINKQTYAINGYNANSYNVGDQFKIVKDAYKYIITNTLWWRGHEKDPEYEDAPYFRKGEIVKYTGRYETDVEHITKTNYFIEVESMDGQRKGLVFDNTLEEYSLSRPSTIEEYIDKYNISSIKNYSDLAEMNNQFWDNLRDLNLPADLSLDDARRIYNLSISGDYDKDLAINECLTRYEELLTIPVIDEDDSNFRMQANLYATIYYQRTNSNVDSTLEASDRFEQAENNASNANNQTDLQTAINDMEEALNEMEESGDYTDEELEEYEATLDSYRNQLLEDAGEDQGEEDDNHQELEEHRDQTAYYAPNLIGSGTDSGQSLDDMIHDGDAFIGHSNTNILNDNGAFQDGVSTLYNIFLEVGVAVAVIIGLIIGIKFMLGSVEEKAEIKKLLWPYAIGCFVVFGAFGIWKIALEIMQSV